MNQPSSVPRTSTNWNVILAFAGVAVSTQLLWVTFTPVTTEAANVLGVSENAVGWLSEVFPLIYVVLAVPFGLLADRWFRPSVAAGALLTIVGAVFRIQGHFPMILAGQVITSVGQPLILNAINKIALLYAAPKRQTAAISLSSASLFLGILFAMLSGPFILGAVGMGALLAVQAGFAIVTGAWLLVALQLSHQMTPLVQSDSVSLRKAWSNRKIRQLCYLLFIGFGLFIAITTWIQALLAPKHITPVEVGVALALMTAAGMVGAAIVPQWAIGRGKGRHLVLASLVAAAAASVFILVGHPFWVMTMLLIGSGFLLLADLPIVLTTAELVSRPEEAGTVTALLMLFGNAGGIVLALCIQGFILSPVIAVGILLLASVVALPFAVRFPEYRSRSGAS